MTVHLRQIVIDAENARGLATFYQTLVGGEYRPGDAPPADGSDDHAEWVTFSTAGGVDLTFQQVAELPRVTWPSGPRGQQMHLDFTVADAQELERHRAWAVASGATVGRSEHGPQKAPVRLRRPRGTPVLHLRRRNTGRPDGLTA